MMGRMQRVSLVALLALAVGLGALWGLRAIPPGETEIIVAIAADYVAETGGEATDCAARPASVDGVRLVVICSEDWARAVDEMGRPVALDPAVLAGETGT